MDMKEWIVDLRDRVVAGDEEAIAFAKAVTLSDIAEFSTDPNIQTSTDVFLIMCPILGTVI